ncbi:MAG: hypothetical protein PHV30_12075, partial [Candidatus Margulisbacteria bacterium]|nr:hypothetical protein [Candidatus Margulisiibacteriota bacterium]
KKKLKAFFKNPSDRILVFDDDSSVFINTIIKDVGQRDILSKMFERSLSTRSRVYWDKSIYKEIKRLKNVEALENYRKIFDLIF